jgi:hypothetical protein
MEAHSLKPDDWEEVLPRKLRAIGLRGRTQGKEGRVYQAEFHFEASTS